MAGLAYEVVWARSLAIVVGNATYSTTAVLAAVMGGMGLGAWLGGRRADRGKPLQLYGWLEIGLGACALAVPFLAQGAESLSSPLLRWAGSGWASAAARLGVAASVVLLPAMLMGATLPALVRFAELHDRRGGDRVGPSTGVLYGLNTAGAALGCVVTGYWALGTLGVRRTSALAAGVDFAVGLAALLLAKRLARRPAAQADPEPRPQASPRALPPALSPGVALGTAFAVGLSVLALETLWTRYLLIVFGHDVHAFASMLAAVLTGLALGAGLYRVLPDRVRASAALVPALLVTLGLGAAASLAGITDAYMARGVDVLDLAP
ncbi:MAG: fused MFS/spermidine synthase, partial [Polyangiales bacterium]